MSAVLTMEMICSDENLNRALISCKNKKTAPGPDNMHPYELPAFWAQYENYVKRLLLQGQYYPMQAKKFYISKPGKSGKREIAILTVLDRMIQKAVNNILKDHFEILFHDGSFGYRESRTTETAINRVLAYLGEGYSHIVAVDIKKYFDNINHKLLISVLRQEIKDDRIIVLIERYLKQRILHYGKEQRKGRGIIQGAPLSPLLANIYLNSFDWYMDTLGIKFVRFADDILLFAKEKNEAETIMEEAQEYLCTKLLLKVNREKSRICEPQQCVFLGYQIVRLRDGNYGLTVSTKNKAKMLRKLQGIINTIPKCGERWWDRIGGFHRGWINYFSLSETSDFTDFLRNVQKWEIAIIRQKVAEEQEEGSNVLQKGLLQSKGFVFLLDWLPVVVSKRRKVNMDEQ